MLLLLLLMVMRELRVWVLRWLLTMLLLLLLLMLLLMLLWRLLVDAVLLTLEISAQDDRLLLREVLGLLQQTEVVDEVGVAGGFLLHGRHWRGRVGVTWVDELWPGQGPSARPGPRKGLKIWVYFHQVWLLGRFRHGREMTAPSVKMSCNSDKPQK